MIDRRSLLSALALVTVPRVASALPAASLWSRDGRSAVRLIAGGGEGSRLRAGLHIRLNEGTKTYWRTPGDSGVPPVFDWSGSANLSAVSVGWPAPRRFPDGNGYSIGYKAEVVLPLAVTPQDPHRPVDLSLRLDYAVCDQVCIPAKGEAHLTLPPGPAADAALAGLLARYEALVPRPAVPGLGLALAGIDRSGAHPAVLIAATVGEEAGPVDLFAEGPDEQWSLPLPEALDAAGGVRRFRLELDGAPRGVDPLGHAVTFTLVAGTRALETRLTLA